MSATPGYRALFKYARPYGRTALWAALGMFLEASVTATFARLIQPMLDDVFVARDPFLMRWLPLTILLLFALRGVGVYLGEYMTVKIARSINFDLRARCFAHYLRLPSAAFQQQSPGELVARMSHYVEQVGHAVTEGGKVLLLDSLMIIGFVTVMLSISWQLTLAVLLVGPLIGSVIAVVGKRYRRISGQIQNSLADVTERTQAAIAGEREIKIYGAQNSENTRFELVNQRNREQNLHITRTNALSTSTVQFLAATALAIVLYVATRAQLGLSAGEFMSFITAMLVLLPSLKKLTTVQALIQRGVVAMENIEAVLRSPPEPDNGVTPLPPVKGSVRFEHIGLRYPGRDDDALQQIDLELAPGTTTALVGPSGSGKTSLAALLPRFVQPSSGRVLIDGVDVADCTLKDLRAQIALVSQQVVLFNDSVRANVAYGALANASAEAVRAALQAADALDFVEALPQGIDSRIGENGGQLSGGQRQRLAIARAVLKDAPILILDEATSALDNASEQAVQAALQRLRAGRTTLVIAHRLSTIVDADQIVVMVDGRIVERGRHAALLAAGGVYAALHARQAATD